jgi:hypothetical protein
VSAALSPLTLRTVARVATDAGRRIRLAMRGVSMLPLLREPMVLEVAPLTRRSKVGDVIVFARGEILVVHRVVRYSGAGYITSGDARPLVTEDVVPTDVLGRVEAVWEDSSASARRVDTRARRLRGMWLARAHPMRALAAATRALAARALRRLPCLSRP